MKMIKMTVLIGVLSMGAIVYAQEITVGDVLKQIDSISDQGGLVLEIKDRNVAQFPMRTNLTMQRLPLGSLQGLSGQNDKPVGSLYKEKLTKRADDLTNQYVEGSVGSRREGGFVPSTLADAQDAKKLEKIQRKKAIDAFEKLQDAKKISKMNDLKQLNELNDKVDKITRMQNLQSINNINQMQQMQKLNQLNNINQMQQIQNLREVRQFRKVR